MEIIARNIGTPQATKEPQIAQNLKADLEHFTGTSAWHRFSPFSASLLTDGALYLAEQAGAFWLMDLIVSHQTRKLKEEPFQVWTLKVLDGHEGRVVCEDGNGNKLAAQRIKYTDFPLPEIKLYAVYDSRRIIILLPSEY